MPVPEGFLNHHSLDVSHRLQPYILLSLKLNARANMAVDTPHIVAVPGWFLVFRILQIILAVVTLGFAAFLTWVVPLPGFGLAIFTAIVSLIIVVYILIASKSCPSVYNYWAILALEIFAVIFWLCTMGVLASYAGALTVGYSGYAYGDSNSYYETSCDPNYYSCTRKRAVQALTKRFTPGYALSVGLIGGTAGIAALELIFFCVTLITFSVFMHRHRKSGAPNLAPGSSDKSVSGPTSEVTHVQPHTPHQEADIERSQA